MKILVFGITGSIGTTLLKNNNHTIVGCSFFNNVQKAKKIIEQNKIKYYYSENFKQHSNVKDLDELVKKTKPDLIVNAVSGFNGLKYTLVALKYKIDLALANKESLVMAGKFIKRLAKKNGVKIYPIDSEHSSLYELLINSDPKKIKQLIITCSGGSCYNKTENELKKISFDEVIKHPNWSMGYKISVDSATLLNKCFEIVEAYHLFNNKNIKALYHPQSIVHSMIEFKDNSIWANMSKPDMSISIDLAINKYQKNDTPLIKAMDFNNLSLTFNGIDAKKWKPIKWAYDIINDKNNSLGIIINYANEKAINMFKNNKIKFNEFYSVIEKYMKKFKSYKVNSINQIYDLIKLMDNTII